MTLSGLALGVGMLVDNAIVVLDNTFKKRDAFIKNLPTLPPEPSWLIGAAKALAREGAEEMFLAITASTLTTIIVFLPLVFINPEIRMLYSGIALTITYSLLASLFAALTLVPMLASRLKLKVPKPVLPAPAADAVINKNSPESAPYAPITEAAANTGNAEPAAALSEAPPSPPPPTFREKMQALYKNIISLCLSLRYFIIILALVGFGRVLLESKKLEKEFIGIAEQNKFTIFIELPTGTRLEISDKIVSKIEEIVSRLPEVKTATSKVEPWSSKIYVELLPLSKRGKATAQVIEGLRPFTDKLNPAFIYYEEQEEIGTKEILIEIYGYDYEALKSLAIQIAQRIQTVPKFTDTKIRMREGRPEMHLNIDRRQAATFGLTTQDVALALHTHMRGLVATHYRGRGGPLVRYQTEETRQRQPIKTAAAPQTETKETETIVRLEEKYRKSFEALRRISLLTPDREPVYLSQVANFKFETGPSEIWRKNKSRMVQVSANTGGLALGTAAERVKEVLRDLKLPKDYFWQLGGNYDKMMRNQSELAFALSLSLVLVYMLLAGLFESFSQPFVILMTVPLSAIGAIIALRLANKPVGTGVLIGSIMLGGIVVNNAIVLVDRINFLRKRSSTGLAGREEIRQVIILASYDRLRPIMMTSLTTILGLIPMALDKSESSSLWAPLAITVIGGMTTATFLTLFVIPCIYLVFKDLRLIKK
jgi:HAE1 family hydrophobic/amphiphilic exporter-1